MRAIARYFRRHERVRIAALCVGYALAAVALYVGVTVFILTLGSRGIGDASRDRFLAAGLVALSAFINIELAWLSSTRDGRFFPRVAFNLSITAVSALLVSLLVLARARS